MAGQGQTGAGLCTALQAEYLGESAFSGLHHGAERWPHALSQPGQEGAAGPIAPVTALPASGT